MDAKVFAAELARSLARRGVPKDEAVKQAVSLVRTFDEDDLREIATYSSSEDFSELSDRLAGFVKEKTAPVNDEDDDVTLAVGRMPSAKVRGARNPGLSEGEMAALAGKTTTVPVINPNASKDDNMKTRTFGAVSASSDENERTRTFGVVTDSAEENERTRTFGVIADGAEENERTRTFGAVSPSQEDVMSQETSVNIPTVSEADTYDGEEVYLEKEPAPEKESDKVVLTNRGRAFFISIIAVSSPLIIIGSCVVLSLFAFGIAALAALIIAALGLVCIEAVAGSLGTIVGLIYGVICIINGGVGEGFFEMGLGISMGAVALALGILTYNLATVALPYAFRQLLSFEGYCFKRVKPMVNRFREECNRL